MSAPLFTDRKSREAAVGRLVVAEEALRAAQGAGKARERLYPDPPGARVVSQSDAATALAAIQAAEAELVRAGDALREARLFLTKGAA